MSQFIKFIFACLLLMTSAQVSSFAQSALENPFEIFHGAKPKRKVDSVLIYRYPYEGAETYLYVYNRHGQLIKCDMYRYFVDLHTGIKKRDTTKVIYIYNTAGKLVSRTYASNGGKPGKILYHYLPIKSGYAIRASPYDSTKVFEMRFNKSRQMIQCGVYKLKNLERQETGFDYQYNSKGYLIGETDYNDSRPANRSSYKYDSNGDEVEVIRAPGRDYSKRSIFKYSNYDKMHNWTQKAVDFVNGYEIDDSIHWQDTIHRRITYYK
ncbi:MAG: hypothetical protein JWR50_1272 [Mucilaginibacter sp.]|nr:hypothetical protein [Mucilaginibacter sp.]